MGPLPNMRTAARALLGALLATAATAWQDPNATAKVVSIPNTCVGPGKNGINPRFLAAGPDVQIIPETLWVVTVKRVRRTSPTDWSNMEHFAASTLPAYEELFRQGVKVDRLALPQVPRAKSFLTARGAETDWFRETALSALDALGATDADDSNLVFRDGLGRDRCFRRVVHATYNPRATYLKDPHATKAFVAAAAKRHASGAPLTTRTVSLILRSVRGGPARRAGPGWSNSMELVKELQAHLAAHFPSWRLEVHTAAHLFAFRQQLRMAQNTGVLVGAHGASLTNALFLSDASAVVEVLNCGHRSNTYRRLATNRGLFYASATPSGKLMRSDCSLDLGRRHVDTRRTLPLSELAPPLSEAIAAVEAKLPSTSEPSCLSLYALEKRSAGNGTVVRLAAVLSSSTVRGMSAPRRHHLVDCAAYRAGGAISSSLATGSIEAFHAERRAFLFAATELRGRPLEYFVDACANALVEAQRNAKYLLYLHVSKAAGTSLCKLAARNRCRAPGRFSTLWASGDGPTWGNCARGLSVVHVGKESVGRGRRARCAAVERTCEQRRAMFEKNNFELMAVERWADNGGHVCEKDIWHATLLRDPLDRVVSHHNHLWSTILRAKPRRHERAQSSSSQYFKGVFQEDGSCITAKDLPYTMAAPHRTGYDWSMVCAISSDYHTRSLLGTAFSPRPYDAETPLTSSHVDTLALAKDRLLRYAVVLTTDDVGSALPILRHALRWRPWSLTEVLPVRDRQAGRKRGVVRRNLSAVDRSVLLARNTLDVALYAFARTVVRADALFYTMAAEAGLFREDVRDPKRPFCGAGEAAAAVVVEADEGDLELDGEGWGA